MSNKLSSEPVIDMLTGKPINPIQEEQDTPSNVVVNKVPVEKSMQTFQVELPSQGVFYEDGFKVAQVSLLSIPQVRMLASARKMEHKYNKERAVISAMSRSLHNYDITKLTYQDFVFLLYWIRLNSYKKSPYLLTWEYDHPAVGRRKVVSEVFMTDLKVNVIDGKIEKDLRFVWETVDDHLEMLKLEDEDDIYFAKLATSIPGANLEEKIKILDTYPADIIIDIKKHQADFNHGVVETIELQDQDYPEIEPFMYVNKLELEDFFP